MRVQQISLLNFRNYQQLDLELAAGKVLLLGRNGQGKTNLIESIAYFDALTSHRVAADAPLFGRDGTSAVLRMQVAHKHNSLMLELELRQGQAKKAQISGNAVAPRELTKYFSAVVFAPEDLQIVKADPGVRRSFLDTAIISRKPYFAQIYKEYERVVKQRSALLKNARGQKINTALTESLEFWNRQLLDLATRIMAERRILIDLLQPHLSTVYSNLVGADHQIQIALKETGVALSEITYTPDGADAAQHLSDVSRETLTTNFTAQLALQAQSELDRGLTLVGTHRDDLDLRLNGFPVKGYASHGESWSVALSLKLALAKILKTDLGAEDPVIILDDVFAELDSNRRKRLLAAVADYEQLIVTAAVAEDIPADAQWQVHIVQQGKILGTKTTADPTAFLRETLAKQVSDEQ